MKHAIHTVLAAAFASFCLCASAGAEIVAIDVPGASDVFPTAMNDKGQVTGYCYGETQGQHGFIWQLHGPAVMFDVPNADTYPTGISAKGVVTGRYSVKGVPQGFVRAADGTITTFSAPHTRLTSVVSGNRNAWSIGDTRDRNDQLHLFLRSHTGTMKEFTVPGSNGNEGVIAVNSSRMIAGVAAVPGQGRGFVRSQRGTITMFGDSQARVTGMNDPGTIVGWTFMNALTVGYIRTSDGAITTFAVNGTTNTVPFAINNSGTIVGQYWASDQVFHGFIRTPDGTFTPFDAEGAVLTQFVAINNKGAMTGFYKNGGGDILGFFGTP